MVRWTLSVLSLAWLWGFAAASASGRELRTFTGHAIGGSSAAFSPDGRFALSGSSDGTLKL